MTKIFITHHIPDPDTGVTPYQENSKREHKYPIGSVVKCLEYDATTDTYKETKTSLRLYVVDHTRDCDQEPLYTLSHNTPEEFKEKEATLNNCIVQFTNGLSTTFKGIILNHLLGLSGYSEDSLELCE
ncbi:MAG: hypothetical protein M0R77_00185 [Gammaproteobacteria bacterium]|nr:hypothetical protein [Acholeplasmataceae bacterium]MCK9528972.1 hypothetical protein [Gammaproteobacteria bacterium]